MTEQPTYGLITPANMPRLANLDNPDSPYPAQVGLFCDTRGCPTEHVADYLVPADSTAPERHDIAREHLRSIGWSCDEVGDYCPECAR